AHSSTEDARFWNDTDDDNLRRTTAGQAELSERVLQAGIVVGQTKLRSRIEKVALAIGADGSGFAVCGDSVNDDNQFSSVEIRSEIQTRGPRVDNLNLWTAFVLAAKEFDR